MNEIEKKPLVSVKNILRVLSVLCTIIVFCPTFLVSCSGQKMDISVMTATSGIKVYGDYAVKPHPIMLICLLIPVAMLVLLFIKKFTDDKVAMITAICGGVDFVIWLIFRSAVKKAAEENYCTYKATGWFGLNMFALVVIIALSVLVVLKILQMEEDLMLRFKGEGTQKALNQMSAAVSQMSSSVSQLAGSVNKNKIPKENIIGYCSKCGTPLVYDNKFCTSCGTPVPESMIAEAEAAKKAAEEAARKAAEEKAKQEEEARKAAEEKAKQEAARKAEEAANAANQEPAKIVAGSAPAFCSNCGAKISAGSQFCQACGTKVN